MDIGYLTGGTCTVDELEVTFIKFMKVRNIFDEHEQENGYEIKKV